jgi:hypothetical protein
MSLNLVNGRLRRKSMDITKMDLRETNYENVN